MSFLEFSTQLVGTIWALLILLVWNALQEEFGSERLSNVLISINLVAGVTVVFGLIGVLFGLPLHHPVSIIAISGTFLFVLTVTAYYIGLSRLIRSNSDND
jgi:hypothetical protein